MTPDQYCQEKCATSGSSFYYSFLFLPPARRQAIMALYAFCREVDDVVDECNDPALASTVAELSTQLRDAVKTSLPPSGEIPGIRPGTWAPDLTDP